MDIIPEPPTDHVDPVVVDVGNPYDGLNSPFEAKLRILIVVGATNVSYLNTTPSFEPVGMVYDEVNECVIGLSITNVLEVTDPDHTASGIPVGFIGFPDELNACNDTFHTDAEFAVICAYTTSTPVISFVPEVQLSLVGVPHANTCSPAVSWVSVVVKKFILSGERNGG
jgi:hypothetical protein